MKISCPKCGARFEARYNNAVCPDCATLFSGTPLTNIGSEDLVSHFHQDSGLRLQRMAWGHFGELEDYGFYDVEEEDVQAEQEYVG